MRNYLLCALAVTALSACGAEDSVSLDEEITESISEPLVCTRIPQAGTAFAIAWYGLSETERSALGCALTGVPESAVSASNYQTIGQFMRFANGRMYKKLNSNNAYPVYQAIYNKYLEHGEYNAGFGDPYTYFGDLGFPITKRLDNYYRLGVYNIFEGGRILFKYQNPGASPVVINGPVSDGYTRVQSENGVLGYPTTYEATLVHGSGNYVGGAYASTRCGIGSCNIRYQKFEGGEVRHRINSPYVASGGAQTWYVLTRDVVWPYSSRMAVKLETAFGGYQKTIITGTGFAPNTCVKFYVDSPLKGAHTLGSDECAMADATGKVTATRALDATILANIGQNDPGGLVLRGQDAKGWVGLKRL